MRLLRLHAGRQVILPRNDKMKNKQQYFIIDFDSTFVTVEALDELANIALKHNPDKEKITEKIRTLTSLGMEGKLSFPESLAQRLKLFSATKEDIRKLVSFLKKNITPSVTQNSIFFTSFPEHIYIISGGFKEYIIPVVKKFGIREDHVLANTFIFDKTDSITGFNKNNLLAQEEGKVKQIISLGLQGKVYVIGDGITDYQIREKNQAEKFFAYTGNVKRDTVVKKADYHVQNFDELLFMLHLPRALSYPKSKMKVLLLENIHSLAKNVFEGEGFQVETYTKALGPDELKKKLTDVSILGIRSKTTISAEVLNEAKKLLTVGVFGIGTNHVDLQACAEKGVAVFNAPYSNTRSVVELTIGDIIMLYRKVFEKNEKMHRGMWDKSSDNCHEIRGKKLGIVGYGNIGSQLSVLAESLGMDVYFYDITDKLALGNSKRCRSLEELLKIADVVTIHVDGSEENKHLISDKEFSLMKDGVIFLNIARGFIVDVFALEKYIKNGKVAGAAVDVFPTEPKSNDEPFVSNLQGLPNTILTPHIGAGTEEGQRNIAEFVPEKLISFINSGNTMLSVNFPNIQLPQLIDAHRFIHIHRNIPGVLAKVNNIFAKNKINIEGQYLKTNEDIGYVITDVNKDYSQTVIKELKSIEGTIRLRILY
jgi:D-3-phosphoglycerate dehydrogenase